MKQRLLPHAPSVHEGGIMVDPQLSHALDRLAQEQRTANRIALANTDGALTADEREWLLGQVRMGCGLPRASQA